MMASHIVWILFFGLGAVIGLAGFYLSIHADQIAHKTGLGRNLMGMILLAAITSLPELIIGVSSVAIAGNPNLAIGDVLGSCVFNLSLVYLLDLIYREGSIYQRASQGHVMTAALGIILVGAVGFTLALIDITTVPAFYHVGISSLFITFLYIIAMKFSYSYEKNLKNVSEVRAHDDQQTLRKNIIIFSLASVFIIGAGSMLPHIGEEIVRVMGWKSAFVGTIFMAFATSLPEIAVTVSAIKMKAAEMALSNLLGSNLFNVVILALDDLFYTQGPLLNEADPGHIITVFSVLLMTGVVILALLRPPEKRILNTTSFYSLIVLLLFALNGIVIYQN